MTLNLDQQPKEKGNFLLQLIWPGLPNLLINMLASGKKFFNSGDEPRIRPTPESMLGTFGKTGGPRRS